LFDATKITIWYCSIELFNIVLWTIANKKAFIKYISVPAMRTITLFGEREMAKYDIVKEFFVSLKPL
jgi:hypothetical protein